MGVRSRGAGVIDLHAKAPLPSKRGRHSSNRKAHRLLARCRVLAPALICRSRGGRAALRNAPKTSAREQTEDRVPSPLAVRRKTPKALRWRGLGRLQNWIGQNVRRRKAYPEKPAAFGSSAALTYRSLTSL